MNLTFLPVKLEIEQTFKEGNKASFMSLLIALTISLFVGLPMIIHGYHSQESFLMILGAACMAIWAFPLKIRIAAAGLASLPLVAQGMESLAKIIFAFDPLNLPEPAVLFWQLSGAVLLMNMAVIAFKYAGEQVPSTQYAIGAAPATTEKAIEMARKLAARVSR